MTFHPREGGRERLSAPLDRRTFLQRSAFAAASFPLASALLAACGAGGDNPGGVSPASLARSDSPVTLPMNEELTLKDGLRPEAGPLEVYNWDQYFNPKVVRMFEDKYGVKVNVNTFSNMNEAVATVSSNSSAKYDVWVADIDVVGQFATMGLLRPLNHSYLPNMANLWDRFKGTEPNQPYYDLGARYTVPYTTYTSGIGWRIDQPEGSTVAGPAEDEVSSWDTLWDPRWKGRIHVLDDFRETIAMSLLKNGITDVNTDDPSKRAANLKAAQDSLVELIDLVDVKADINDYTDLPEGLSLIHHGWSGDFIAARWNFPSSTADRDVIRYWSPESGGTAGNDVFTVTASGANPVLAHLFINFLLDFDVSMVNFQYIGYIPPMTDMDPDKMVAGGGESYSVILPGLRSTIATEADISRQLDLAPLSPEVTRQWQDVWEAFQSGS